MQQMILPETLLNKLINNITTYGFVIIKTRANGFWANMRENEEDGEEKSSVVWLQGERKERKLEKGENREGNRESKREEMVLGVMRVRQEREKEGEKLGFRNLIRKIPKHVEITKFSHNNFHKILHCLLFDTIWALYRLLQNLNTTQTPKQNRITNSKF